MVKKTRKVDQSPVAAKERTTKAVTPADFRAAAGEVFQRHPDLPHEVVGLMQNMLKDLEAKTLERAELQRALQASQREATIDPKTQTLSFNGLTQTLGHELAQISRGEKQQLGLLFIDYDDFKGINSKYTHPGGDACLANTGQTLKAAVRDTDTVARFGGDEFVILLQGKSPEGLKKAASKVAERFANSNWSWAGENIPHRATFAYMTVDKTSLMYGQDGRTVDVGTTWEHLAKQVSAGLLKAKEHKHVAIGQVHFLEAKPARRGKKAAPGAQPK